MTNPHYTCPIISAYMARYFGVKYKPQSTPVTYSFMHNDISGGFDFYFIHPESLSIFQPQEGDKDKNGAVYNGKDWFIKPNNYVFSKELKTAFRNNQPFFMPEGI